MNEHTKHCYARAMIAKIQNERDSEYLSVIEFKIMFQQVNMVAEAVDYLDSLMECSCEQSTREKA